MSQGDLLDAEILPLFAAFFSEQRQFFIPSYQRPYAWEKRQREDFWNDLQHAFQHNPQDPYLLGTIYLSEADAATLDSEINSEIIKQYTPYLNANPAVLSYLLVDGQQRATTFFLLCYCVPSLRPSLYNENHSKLVPGRIDHAFFQNLIAGKPTTPTTQSQLRLLASLQFFQSKQAVLDDPEFANFLQNRLQIVRILLKGNRRLATVLFVSQTDRGKRLTVLERLKSALIFYSQRDAQSRREQAIDELFTRLYEHLEYLLGFNVYERSQEAEADVVRILHVLLYKRDFYRKAWRDADCEAINWEAGEERLYDWINMTLRNAANAKDALLQVLTQLQDGLQQIETFLAYLVAVTQREHSGKGYISHFDQTSWFPSLQTFGVLGLSRFTKAWLVDLFNQPNCHPMLFTEPALLNVQVESHYEQIIRPAPDVWSQEILQRLRDKLSLLNKAQLDNEAGILYRDVQQIMGYPALRLYLALQLQESLARIDRFIDLGTMDYLSVFNLAESLELTLWKIGKYPVGSFMGYSAADILDNALRMVNDYRRHYLLRDLGYASYKYILLEYERVLRGGADVEFRDVLRSEVDKDDELDFHREHIFAQEPQQFLTEDIKAIWPESSELYQDWIWRFGNIALLEHDINIGEASNKPVWEKAECYQRSRFLHVRSLGLHLLNLKKLANTGDNAETKVLLAASKLLLEIRDLELRAFCFCRF